VREVTGRDSLEVEEKREAIFARDGWCCQNCGRPIREGEPQLAHRIPQNVRNLRKYGPAILHHPDNLASACGLRCNSALDIGGHPLEVAALALEIAEKIDKSTQND
jgi:5-methylcytosine-specific restriction endonuclease McrA